MRNIVLVGSTYYLLLEEYAYWLDVMNRCSCFKHDSLTHEKELENIKKGILRKVGISTYEEIAKWFFEDIESDAADEDMHILDYAARELNKVDRVFVDRILSYRKDYFMDDMGYLQEVGKEAIYRNNWLLQE